MNEKAQLDDSDRNCNGADVDIDLREVYFLIMHFLSAGPCHRTYGQFWNELLEHQLLPRRYHAWYSRSGANSGDENDDGSSFPLSYNKLVERYPHVEKDHLVKLLKQLILGAAASSQDVVGRNPLNAAAVPTLLGTGSFSLLGHDAKEENNQVRLPPGYMHWPHMQADQVRGLQLREIGGGFSRHHRAPSIRAASYAIAKPSTMVQKMQNFKKLRGHRNAVYCATFDRLGRYVITGSDDRLVKIWSMETAYCLASCRGHEGDITDLAVSFNNALVASASNDCIIRVWRLADGLPISVLRGHTGAVTAIAFSPRPGSVFQLLSSSDDGTCRIWDVRHSQSQSQSQFSPRIYVPKPLDSLTGKSSVASSSTGQQGHQIFCCAFNASGTVFVTGSSDTLARVWNACKPSNDHPEQPNHELDILAGHENDVNYVQFSGCAVASRLTLSDASKEENIPKFRNTWFTHDNIVTCSRDGSAIIWVPRSRRSHGKAGRWTRAYHLKVPPPPMPPQPPRGGPRQRILPTPRGVNMIVWSLDNRFVLAAIMDCRICVWNAVDGSLVHSLTGHSESTYVLDVHPFNPRIAMSAGYDGKTIVWDIWEGIPIRVYEMGRFKLVDGKFSPDGTSIILSDDVGQLYILSTGQGESQKDAKYDQFFLGDYRPLVQDTHGNVLDQETQLVPYRRNMQDLLCDSGMIPYPDPYQSMYQQRRLGALGIEWRPSSVRFAVGTDISLDQEYQMPPIADLDVLFDPLPEFLDAMDWEPEIEVQSDDNDSEYNVTEEYHSAGDQGSLSFNSSGDLNCSTEDSEDEKSHEDGLRRSKRKKLKAEVEIMTSSGRRIKRRNLDQSEGNSSRNNRIRKFGNGKKASRKKSSLSKSSRPRRAAARNALNLFSRITGKSMDGEDEDDLEVNSTESESTLQDSNIESEESEASLGNEQNGHSKGKEVSMNVSETLVNHHNCPVSHMPSENRKRLVFKLPNRDSNKRLALDKRIIDASQLDAVGASSEVPQGVDVSRNYSQDPGCSFGDRNGNEIERNEIRRAATAENHFNLLDGYRDGEIRWGGVKSRSSKRSRMVEPLPSSASLGPNSCLDDHVETQNFVNGLPTSGNECSKVSASSEIKNLGDKMDETVDTNQHQVEVEFLHDLIGGNYPEEHSGFDESRDHNESQNHFEKVVDDRATSENYDNAGVRLSKLEENSTLLPTKLRIRSSILLRDQENPAKFKIRSSEDHLRNGEDAALSEGPSEVPNSDSTVRPSSDHGVHGDVSVDTQIDISSQSVFQDSERSHSRDRMFREVYRRSKSLRAKGNLGSDGGGMEVSTSNADNNNLDEGAEPTNHRISRTRSTKMESTGHDVIGLRSNVNLRAAHDGSVDTSTSFERSSFKGDEEQPHGEWRSSSRVTVGLRSTRTRRGSYYTREISSPEKKKSHQSARSSWLMLSMHEGSRYIPQLGDDVVYLRQGHQDFLNVSKSKEPAPWRTFKGNIRAVEFCRVKDLEYSERPGSGESCCKMTLQFVDPSSSVVGKSFKLSLPELTGFPDFLVERNRYDAAIERNWRYRDKCQVWWKNEGEEDGNWWDGRIVSVKPKSPDFPDSPWERFSVQYKDDPTVHQHSPWELYDAEMQWEEPHIDDEVRYTLLPALAKLEQSGNKAKDPYGVQKLKQVSQKSQFINRFPVPLSLEVIHSRLENNYYRRLGAMKHDIEVMLENAESYFQRNGELLKKMKQLSDWFRRTLSSL